MKKTVVVLLLAFILVLAGCGEEKAEPQKQEVIDSAYSSEVKNTVGVDKLIKNTKWTGTDHGSQTELIFRDDNSITIITMLNNSVVENGEYRIQGDRIFVKLYERSYSAKIETDGEQLIITYKDKSKGEFTKDTEGRLQ